MKLIQILSAAALCSMALPMSAQRLVNPQVYGPAQMPKMLMIDSVNVANKKWDLKELLKAPVFVAQTHAEAAQPQADGFYTLAATPKDAAPKSIVYTFDFENDKYRKGDLCLFGRGRFALFVDEKFTQTAEKTDSLSMAKAALKYAVTMPVGQKRIAVRMLSLPGDTVSSFRLVFVPKGSKEDEALKAEASVCVKSEKYLTMYEMMNGRFLSSVSTSPDGRFVLVKYNDINGTKTDRYTQLRNSDGKVLQDGYELGSWSWMQNRNATLYRVVTEAGKYNLVTKDVATGKETVELKNLPRSGMTFTPNMDAAFYYEFDRGPAKDAKVIRRLGPEDRQGGARDRKNLYKYDTATGVSLPITYGKHNVSMLDINEDGSKILIGIYETNWSEFPYHFADLLQYDVATGQVDTLLTKQIDVDNVMYIPRHKGELLIVGSANAFNGIGKTLPADQPANSYEKQLFLFNMQTKQVKPLTKDFNPHVDYGQFDLRGDAFIFRADNGSRKSLYRLDLKSHRITPIPVREDVVRSFSVAEKTGQIWYNGQSVANADRLYTIKGNKQKMVWDLSAEKLKGVNIGSAHDWNYTAPDGTVVEGWYYLPPHFDPAKKYPMLVYYYGGTTPTQRTLEGTYSLAMFAAQGYVVYTLNPSGTYGYGQEFAARHLNAWGDRTADEIIGATKEFARTHDFVNAKKIGCFGASYGGFMTQYLQTKTDIFAAAISHAGISSISNYWGSGYWGMGYNAVAAYKSYPWNNPNLYVKHSPLFNADKIHTPLLLLHGSADTNVPTAESVNMYNALKVLGRTVEFIEFTTQDHFILEHDRKITWLNSMYAWFAKWLQDNPEWWDEMYPQTAL